MKRGEIRTVAGGPYYTNKPRPVVIIQADWYTEMDSITVCPLTSDNTDAPSVRIPVHPTEHNGRRSLQRQRTTDTLRSAAHGCFGHFAAALCGLCAESRLMPDKVVTVPEARPGSRIGQLDHTTLAELSRRMISFLNLADSGPSQLSATPTTRNR
jgi:mRNA interferase MazF